MKYSDSIIVENIGSFLKPILILKYTWTNLEKSEGNFLADVNIFLMNLTYEEMRLDFGRFEKFSIIPRDHEVTIAKLPESSNQVSSIFENMVTWISENTTDRWNFELFYKHMSDFDFVFSFDNKNDAVLFKLTF